MDQPAGPPIDDDRTLARIYLSLHGRLSRRDFWLFGVLALIGVAVLALLLLAIAGVHERHAEIVVNLLLFWPGVAVSVKRWHDRDKSGWWVLVALVPVIGWLWALIENGLLRGTAGANRFGADPLIERPILQ